MLQDLNEDETALLEGMISVAAALEGGRRHVHRLLLRAGREDGQTRRVTTLARRAGVPLDLVSSEAIEARAGGKTHGGVLAEVGPYQFAELSSLVDGANTAPFVAMIDGVEDPFNFGQAVRALYAAGADGLIVPRNWLSAAGVVARASAGASEMIPTALAETADEAASFFRAQGLKIACASDAPGSTSLYDTDLTGPLFLLVGGEKRGVTRSFLAQADLKLRIPYGRSLPHSLGTAPATAIIAFEVLRQRNAKVS